jgi:hypothetical protein
MHIDENKKFDIRNIERNIKEGIISQKDYENYLSKLPDVSDKIYNPDEPFEEEIEAIEDNKKQVIKKKGKCK